jgi:hypothetical protein
VSDLALRNDPPLVEYTEEEYLLSPKLFIETFFEVKDPNGNLVPFVLNTLQNEYYDYLMANHFRPFTRQDGSVGYRLQGIRDIHLKHRQWGLSTLINALYAHDTWCNPGTDTIIYCQDAEFSADMLGKWGLFYDGLPSWFKPIKGVDQVKHKSWPGILSSVRSGTPGVSTKTSNKQGRSKTLRNVLCSEFPEWANPDTTLNSLLDAVPLNGNVIIEGTAKEMGDTFHIMYQAGKKEAKLKVPYIWTSHFTPWISNPDKRLSITREQAIAIINTLSKEEKRLVKLYPNLTIEALAWRRFKISEKNNSVLEFNRENPENDVDCFASAAPMIFPRWTHKLTCKPRPAISGHIHVIGADISMGVRGGDNSAVEVIDAVTMENIFSFHCNNIPPDMLALIIYDIWLRYPGYVGIESNSIGQATMSAANKLDWWGREGNFLFTNNSNHGGWHTNGSNKPSIIFNLRTAIGEFVKGNPGLAISSEQFVKEQAWFQKGKDSHSNHGMGAPSKSTKDGKRLTDDSVMAMAIAYAQIPWLHLIADPFMERFGYGYEYQGSEDPFWEDPTAWLERQNIQVASFEVDSYSSI